MRAAQEKTVNLVTSQEKTVNLVTSIYSPLLHISGYKPIWTTWSKSRTPI